MRGCISEIQKKDQQICVISNHSSGLRVSRNNSCFDDKYISSIHCVICVTSSPLQLVTEEVNETLLILLIVQEDIFLVLHCHVSCEVHHYPSTATTSSQVSDIFCGWVCCISLKDYGDVPIPLRDIPDILLAHSIYKLSLAAMKCDEEGRHHQGCTAHR